jgi:glycolate oxidase FAD binding subunit
MIPDSALSSVRATTVEEQLRAIVGAEHVRTAGADDSIRGARPQLVVEPADEQEVATVLRCANDAGLAVVPRGGGTKLDWGNPPARADIVLSMGRLDRVIDHAWADLTATVEAGCTIAELQRTLAQHGQRLAVDVLWPEQATIGGILSTNDSGALRLRYGGLRDLIIGVSLALADGTPASSGGRVVKNVAGYDLQKLATGALGTLGVITRATFRVHPLAKNTRTLTITPQSPRPSGESTSPSPRPSGESVRVRGVAEIQALMLAIQDSQGAHSALQARLSGNTAPEIDVLFEGTEAGIAAQEAQVQELVAGKAVREGEPSVWAARQALWEPADEDDASGSVIAKLSILPADLAATMGAVADAAASRQTSWRAVVQATGLGWLRLDGAADELTTVLRELREGIERRGGSLVVMRQPSGAAPIDSWGDPGDALQLMQSVKRQLDAKSTLNPGRFVGGM